MARNREISTRMIAASLACMSLLLGATSVLAQQLPPQTQWRASSSAIENPELASSHAIDGDPRTRWGGAFSAGHWWQVDFGRTAEIAGAIIRWDSGFTETYLIQTSTDGQQWQTVSDIRDGSGFVEYVFFPTTSARYMRLASQPRTADWGVSVFEFEPIAAGDAPVISGLGRDRAGSVAWTGNAALPMTNVSNGAATMQIRLRRPLDIAGLQVFWGSARASARLEARRNNEPWRVIAEDPEALGEMSYLAAAASTAETELRLTVRSATQAPEIRRLRLLSPSQVMTSLKRYEIKAARDTQRLFPEQLYRHQVYWTAIGIPGGKQKSVLDEFGNLEAFKGAPMVQAIWRSDGGQARTGTLLNQPTQSLREGWMPMPTVRWASESLPMRIDAFAIEQAGAPVTLVRYRLANTGSTPLRGQLALVVRPLQVNPSWQHGGIAAVRNISVDSSNEGASVRVNGREFLQSLTPVTTAAAAPFGSHGETEITAAIASGQLPNSRAASDPQGLASGALIYRVEVPARSVRDVVLAFPLGNEHVDFNSPSLPPVPTLDVSALLGSARDAGAAFDALAEQVASQWQSTVGRIQLSLPDRSLIDTVRAQTAYMLINQTGHAMQPGPRNYNRSFIRDGAATASILARMGMGKVAREYLRWYSDHAVHANGLVSPILNEDGSVNRGFGSDLEHDSQGQFVWLVAEIARVDGGVESVKEYEPKVRLALKYLQELRERTMVPGYLAEREAPRRFHGILAPSISHEGYSVPTHSYWDDYWGLRGWHDAIWLAEGWGKPDLAKWAREQYEALRSSMRQSIQATMAWKNIDFIPASADTADWDPTSVSIGIDPANQMDLMPQAALKHTFDRYLGEVRKRDEPNALYAYTPYEIRNVLTYVHLNEPRQANELLTNFVRHRRPAAWHVWAEVVHSLERRDRYMGDMPHTWIGSEYVRCIFGMLMREDGRRLRLLPGAPPAWLAGEGIRIGELPVAYGSLTITARQQDEKLQLTLGPGLNEGTQTSVSWPSRVKPVRVTVDGKVVANYDENGIDLDRPFKKLIAQW